MQQGDIVNLKIDRLSYNGGRGVGRYDGLVVFVPETAPNELIEAKIVAVKKNFTEAELIKILEPSPFRRKPPCPVAGVCGGCSWQHVVYEEQLRQKEAFLRYALARALREKTGEPPQYGITILPAPSEFRYRNRIQIHVEGAEYGFYAKRSREIVSIEDCLIAEAELLKNFSPNLSAGSLEISLDEFGQRHIRELDKGGPSFAQVNTQQNEVLRAVVVDYVARIGQGLRRAFDIYCGDGNLSFPILDRLPALQLEGVELSKAAVQRARDRANKSGFNSRAKFISADAQVYLKTLKSDDVDAAVMILDPPRAGLGKSTVSEISRLGSCGLRGVILISCDLGSFERDVGLLQEQFSLIDVTGIDMFPQTEYVEVVSLFLSRAAQKP